mgnify:FL=1
MTLSTILIGILPSVFFGVATTLMGKTGGSGRQRVMGAVLGGLLMAAVATPFLHPAWTPLNLGVFFLTGLLLGVGVCDQLRSYSVLGMSRTMPPSTGGQLVLMSLAGIAIFGEWLRGGVAPEDSLRHRRMFPSIFNGVLWGTAILLLQLNSNNLGAGTGFTLSQLGILISTPLGILWLHETRTREELRWTIIGVALVIVGGVLAGVAKTLDVA